MRLMAIALATTLSFGVSSCAEQNNQFENAVKPFTSNLGQNEPGILISIMKDEREIYRFSSGLSNLELEQQLSGDTQMRIASLSKQFVAVAIMQLAEAKKIDLDQPILSYLPKLYPAAAGVTIRHLLNHTSGLPHHTLMFMNSGRVPYDEQQNSFLFAPLGSRDNDFMPVNEDVVALLSEFPEPRFTPGERWEYSNAGYIILAQLIESVSGQVFRDYIAQHIFAPLGMVSSGVFDESRPIPPNRGYSYVASGDGFEERDYSPFNLLHGDGGLYSTLNDLVKWRRAWAPDVLLSSDSLESIQTPAALGDESVVTDTPRGAGYGMGWFLDTYGSTPVLLHGGGWAAFRHAITSAPTEGLWVVVLTNRDDTKPYELAEALLNAALQTR